MKNLLRFAASLKIFKLLVHTSLAFLIFLIFKNFYVYHENSKIDNFNIFLVTNPDDLKGKTYILEAYKSVLEEEGVPYKIIEYPILCSLIINEQFINNHPAVILPDGIIQRINPEAKQWFKDYLQAGGNILLVYDAGIKNFRMAYLDKPVFSELAGINYCQYTELKENSYTHSYIKVNRNDIIKITPGKIDEENRIIKSYHYGQLQYPIAVAKQIDPSIEILASTHLEKQIPISTLKTYKKGKIMYVNLPLGYLKAYSDDLILRTFLRSFLFEILTIPHLVNTPSAKGGVIINWHIDANQDWVSIPTMIKEKYFRENLEYSNHITAGEFRDTPGDKLGFDACGKGRKYVQMILKYGEIGSHGGWAHNYFSYGLLNGKIDQEKAEYYIYKNNQCLESITGKKIKEYSAPNGVHPQPFATQILEKLGIIAYYYTGDIGSSPNRTFFDGKMVSKSVIAFPVCSYKEDASLFEMWKNQKSEEEVEKFLLSLLDYTKNERVIRLFYSHPYDIPHYPKAIKNFIDKAEKLQKKGHIQVKSMKYFAEFLLRFLQTKYKFQIKEGILNVEIHNPLGLQEITLAIPKNYVIISDTKSIKIDSDKNYNYYIIQENITSFQAKFKNISN